MRITLLWPFGRYHPSDVVDVDERIAQVLIREAFARPAGEPARPPAEPAAPTVADLQDFARRHDCTLTEARDRMAEAQANPPDPLAPPTTQEAPSCA